MEAVSSCVRFDGSTGRADELPFRGNMEQACALCAQSGSNKAPRDPVRRVQTRVPSSAFHHRFAFSSRDE